MKHYDAKQDEQRSPTSRFFPPTREQLLNWAPFWAVILLGALLRFWGLGDKPLHHDESLHAFFSLQLMHNLENWLGCFSPTASCYRYDPLLHGPFQFHAIALVYKISQLLGAPEHGVNTTTVRITAALLGTALVGLPYFLRDYLGKVGACLASFLLAISPSMLYFSRFAREDIYMAFFTLLLIVAVGRYMHTRYSRWLITAAIAFTLSYATKEATFLTIAVFGSFFAALLVWEAGLHLQLRERLKSASPFVPRTAAPLALFLFFLVMGLFAKLFFAWLHDLSIYITKNQAVSNQFVLNLKNVTISIVPWIGILLGSYVLFILIREMLGKLPPPGHHRLAKWIDARQQPSLHMLLTMEWTHWFFALLCAWAVFLLLFTVLFTNIRGGIGDGIWQGLYYWLQQQQVARGEQPWYYYLLLIPLYEQIGVLFGAVGIVRCLLHPTRFRLFLVWWFVGNTFIYSWAAEKMPWLMIHMTMPLMLLAAIGLEPAVTTLIHLVQSWLARSRTTTIATGGTAIASVVLAVLLLLPTLQNMYQVTYIHPADAPYEMMVYVQTTKDVNTVMAKIAELNQKLYGDKLDANGKHMISIGVMGDATWPFAWYLRDYGNVYYQNDPTRHCQLPQQDFAVIITGGDCLYPAQTTYQDTYVFSQYHLRSWWDEGYKPPATPCTTAACTPVWGGVGPLLWLSHGDIPSPDAKFDAGLALKHIWQWWWQRKPIGSTQGAYNMGFFVQR